MFTRASLFRPLRKRSQSPILASYYIRRPSLPGVNSRLPPIHQRPFSAVASLLPDSVLLDVGVIGLIGSVLYWYRQSSRANESLQSTKLDLREEQVLNLNLKTEMEKIQTLYRQSSDDLSRTAQQLKTTSDHRESAVQEIQRLKSLVELQKTSDLGQMGEEKLELLLEEAKKEKLIESFDVQPTVANKLRPDAIATLKNGRTLVFDSKAGNIQMETTDEARQQYAKNLKDKMTALHKKGYTAQVPQSYNTVWMLLPHDRDLQRAYEGNDVLSDVHGIHQHAQEKNIQLVGPESFLCSLRILQLVQSEQEQWTTQDGLRDPSTLLGPILTDLIKQYRKTETKHEKLIEQHNAFVKKLVEYHKTGQKVLNSDKLRKQSIPKGLTAMEDLDGLLPNLEESSVSSLLTDFFQGS